MGKLAIVTGANKGIGFAIVKALCKSFDGDVVLTSRDVERGQAAVAELEKEGLHPKMMQLDISSGPSVSSFAEQVKSQYGGVDILVNNAGIAYKGSSTAPFSEQAEVTMNINFWGTKNVCDALWPLLRNHARVVIVSSMASRYALNKVRDSLRLQFVDPNITMQQLQTLMDDFVKAAKAGDHEKKGWANSAYGTTKIGCTVMARILQREITRASPEKDIVVNACCPGYVDTDMSSHKGHLTPDQGAETPVYLALLPWDCEGPRGQFVEKKQVTPWQ